MCALHTPHTAHTLVCTFAYLSVCFALLCKGIATPHPALAKGEKKPE